MYTQRISAFNVKFCCFSTNCIVWIKPLKILLPVYPHSIAFEKAIALYYFILLIHTNLQWLRFSVHYLQKLAVLPFLDVKSLVYLNKSCPNTFYIYLQNNNTCISYRSISLFKVIVFQEQNKWYLPWIKSQTFRLYANVETAIEHDYRNEWPIVVTCYSR